MYYLILQCNLSNPTLTEPKTMQQEWPLLIAQCIHTINDINYSNMVQIHTYYTDTQ